MGILILPVIMSLMNFSQFIFGDEANLREDLLVYHHSMSCDFGVSEDSISIRV